MTEQAATVEQAIDNAIRPNMLSGLQDADLSGPGGTQRIGEWADWIAKTAADAVRPFVEPDGEAASWYRQTWPYLLGILEHVAEGGASMSAQEFARQLIEESGK